MEKQTLKILNDFYKGIKMGEDSYAMLIEKTDDEKFKSLLQKQSARYENFLNSLHHEYDEKDKKPSDTPIMQKVMGWSGIEINTMMDSSNSHISEMLIQGAIMGYIECYKLTNSNPDMEEGLKNKIVNFSKLQLQIIDELTPYLKK